MTYTSDVETQKIEYLRWVTDNGDGTHRVNYDLNQNSIVFDLGGYQGNWAKTIHDKCRCHLYVFEPVVEYQTKIRQKFEGDELVKIIGAAASNMSSTTSINISGDASSMFTDGNNTDILTIDIVEFIRSENISFIDLMKINIEGAEYDVMEHLIRNNLHTMINNFQIQYHLNVKSYDARLEWITSELVKTHIPTYSYRYIWEGWRLK